MVGAPGPHRRARRRRAPPARRRAPSSTCRLRRDMLSEFECPGFQLGYVYRDVAGHRATTTLTPEPDAHGRRLPRRPRGPAPACRTCGCDGRHVVYDHLGDGFTLLRVGAGRADAVTLWCRGRGGLGVPLDGPRRRRRRRSATTGIACRLVLVRPDQHVAWRSRADPTVEEAARPALSSMPDRRSGRWRQYRNRFGPHNPGRDLRPARLPGAARRPRRGAAELRRRRRRVEAGAAAHPRPDRVVVGLRGGAAAARRALPGLRRRPARPGPLDPHARPLHARQHGQRPRAVHRRRHRPADVRAAASRRAACCRRGSPPTRSPARSSPPHYEDPPLFASEIEPGDRPGHPPGHRRRCSRCGARTSATSGASATGTACVAAAPDDLPPWLARLFTAPADEPPQNLKEYDPEWGRAFWTGTVAASCDHARMLRSVKVPVLLTHHFRMVDGDDGLLMGALSDVQAARVRELLERPASPSTTARSRRWATRCTARTRSCSPTPSSTGSGPRRRRASRCGPRRWGSSGRAAAPSGAGSPAAWMSSSRTWATRHAVQRPRVVERPGVVEPGARAC